MSAMNRVVSSQKVCERCGMLLISGQVKLVRNRGIFCLSCAPVEQQEQISQRWHQYWFKCKKLGMTLVILYTIFWFAVANATIPTWMTALVAYLTILYAMGMALLIHEDVNAQKADGL